MYQMMLFPVILDAPNPDFKVTLLFDAKYLRNRHMI